MRPYLSASKPNVIPPNSIPMLVTVEIMPPCAPLKPNVAIMDVKVNDSIMMSILSSPRPKIDDHKIRFR